MSRRHLPIASDRDRISAARYAAEKLHNWMKVAGWARDRRWTHWHDLNGAVISERS